MDTNKYRVRKLNIKYTNYYNDKVTGFHKTNIS